MTNGPEPAPPATPSSTLPGYIAVAETSCRLAELARRAASRAPSVLITGDSGTGKSHLARAMHDVGRGGAAPFVIIDCGNLPEGLAENELFGHEAGAFSGATDRRSGKFEVAHGGTVLLDRVADLPMDVQGKLLRVLQERAFERVGGHETVRVDVSVIATANESPKELVRRGAFREDLFYRLDVVHLHVPALAERPEDVPALAEAFLARLAARQGRRLRITPRATALLERHGWPGNVRELHNVVERAATFSDTGVLDESDLAPALSTTERSPEQAIAVLAESELTLFDLERLYLQRVLHRVGGRIGRAAAVLGIHRKTLLQKRKRHGLL